MIHKISVSNFYSIEDKATIDFTVDQHAPDNNTYATSEAGPRVSLIETIVGPNASGKTNLMRALPFFEWLVTGSFEYPHTYLLPFRQFASKREEPTEVEAVFDMDGKVFTYSFEIIPERILSEKLKVQGRANRKVSSKVLFKREWDTTSLNYKLNARNFGLPANFSAVLRGNASLVSTASRLNHEFSQSIVEYWNRHNTNVIESGWLNSSDEEILNNSLDFYSENLEYKSIAEDILSRFDIGFHEFLFEEETDGRKYSIAHKFGDKTINLPVKYESSGTKSLFVLLQLILHVLGSGGLLVVDEFDANLHPDIVSELINMFADPVLNPNRAQILLSTHSITILNQLDKYQLILVEKNDRGSTEAWRLDDIKDVRTTDNFFSKYLAGAYGAKPRLG